jgi:hypothetical protein
MAKRSGKEDDETFEIYAGQSLLLIIKFIVLLFKFTSIETDGLS